MMSDELIQKAHEYIISDRPLRSSEETLADFAAECVKDALALADAADNYCDRCGDIVQVNAIERAIRAERERIAKQLEEFVWKHNNDERHIGVEPCQVCQICDELCAIYTTLLREEGK